MKNLIPRNPAEFEAAYNALSQAKILGCDTETSGLDARRSLLYSVQFSDGERHVLVPTSEGVELGKLSGILEDKSITKIFHNSRFDLGFLTANGYTTRNVYDTMIAERVLTRGANQSVSLAETLYRYFAVDLDKSQRKKFSRGWDKVWTPELVQYAISDVAYLPKLMAAQVAWMEKLGLKEDYEDQMAKLRGEFEF